MDNRNQISDAYEELCSLENLELAFKRARKGKTKKDYVLEFSRNLKDNLLKLRVELLMQTYNPRPLKTFIIRDPKTRKISKSSFRDRVIHHALCNIIEPVFENGFISDSFANRIGKGSFNAIKRFDVFKRKVSKNNTRKCFVLKADIKHYFETVNHEILLKILERKIKDERIIWLITRILNNYKTETQGKGMPLGNLTSQFFANIYLNELDQYVKHKLKIKYYIRYVDDFVILSNSKEQLYKIKVSIDQFLKFNLDLELHKEKSQVLNLDKGIEFLGFRIFYYHKLIREKSLRRFRKKFEQFEKLYLEGLIPREKIIEKFEGWNAYISYGNTFKYRKDLMRKFSNSFSAKSNLKIDSVKKHENFNLEIDLSKIEFTYNKTLFLIKKGFTIKQISDFRKIKESTVWDHLAYLIENHLILLKTIIDKEKVKKILFNIKDVNERLTDIKNRINDDSITFNEINCVLANLKGKNKKKSICYYVNWYKKVNCRRKCYYNKLQRETCRNKFQVFLAKNMNLTFNKKEFLNYFHDNANVCILPDEKKRRFVSWKEFKKKIK